MHTNHRRTRLATALIALALGLFAIACGSGGSAAVPTKIGVVATAASTAGQPTAAPADHPTLAPSPETVATSVETVPAATSLPDATDAPAAPQTYTLGDIITIKDVTLVVLGWERPKGDQFSKPKPGQTFVAVDLLMVNTGDAPAAISSLIQMSLKDGKDQKYTPDLLASTAAGANAPDGDIAPGERVRGKIGFALPADAKDLVFVFDADVFGSGKVFVALGEQPATLDPPAELAGQRPLPTHQLGETISAGDLKLTVNAVDTPKGDQLSTPKAGNRFVAVDLTIENTGQQAAHLSTLAQMSLKDRAGWKYSLDLLATTAAGGSTPEGELAPGEKLRGKVGFQVPKAATGLLFVFDADVLGAGRVFVTLP
jgi:uncharacterized protein DUF4352